jgi:phosphoribosylaminoimidazolecarboxamide formyltransferase/IMP cyclohydrolase
VRRIERALISVYDKSGVVEFAAGLADLSVELLATGSTGRLLVSKGIRIREVSEYTGFPEMLDGRVKTLHPRIAGGLLAMRSNPEHMRQAAEHGISMIDLVCVNLYPFAETIKKIGVPFEEVIENIDIGGPSMIRAAAKNCQDVAVVTSPQDYLAVLDALRNGAGVLDRELLLALGRKAFLCTARYDALIAEHLSKTKSSTTFPADVFLNFEKVEDLRYGENPHQKAAFYAWGRQVRHGLAAARLLQGPQLSYNNIVDLDAAWNLAVEFEEPACCIIKHTNPCGAAVAGSLKEAYLKAYAADSLSAFGSVIGFNRNVDLETALELAKLKIDAIVAPAYEREAQEVLAKRKNLRLLALENPGTGEGWASYEIKRVSGGVLLQELDRTLLGSDVRVVTARQPSGKELLDLNFAWRIAKHVKSNAIVLAKGGCTLGVGAGQMSRVDSVKISTQKAGPASKGSVLASDAYFPFRDGVDEAANAGVTAIIQPGGSVRDNEVIDAANSFDMAMILTGLRHFKH